MAKINKISGFPEWLPEQKIAEDKVIATIKRIYESHGFAPIETPAVELLSTLGSKGVIDKEIFVVKRLKAEADDEAELGLHFDLTVPLARYVAQHAHALSFPFRRYQLQKVWRGDRPQKGRFREFYQFDIDIIARNELPLSCDAEVLGVVGLVMKELNVGPYSLRINSRKLLSALYGAVGLEGDARKSAIIAVDKLLKIGRDGVARELSQIPGISQQAIEKILESTTVQCTIAELPERIGALQLHDPLVEEGVRELSTICSLLPRSMAHNVTIDVSLARGLDYYTGLILEVGLVNHPEFGTVVAGGRYDNLTSEFTDQKFPGVGVSIGLGRLMDLLISEGLVPTQQKCPSVVLVTVYDENDRVVCNEIAHELRELGLPTEVFFKSPKLGKQIEYAEEKGMRYVFFVDATTRGIKVKDLVTKEQVEIQSLAAWVASL
jgi:histidyl-tRNA synthetase